MRKYFNEKFDTTLQTYIYEEPYNENEPEYLTGTTEKTRRYGDPIYERLFSHFKTGLENSNHLIIIGYGFKDDGINKLLAENYFGSGKNVLVIDPIQPNSELLIKSPQKVTFLGKSIIDVSLDELINWQNEN